MRQIIIIVLFTFIPNIVNACTWDWVNPLLYTFLAVYIFQLLLFLYSLNKIIRKIKKWSKWMNKKLILLIIINLFVLFILNSIYSWITWLFLCS